ncbi:hypothetical protein [Streptomyces virginiae]|uniref:hypothetical protein n=1 Tax=Streptomyces virginiae TaxID=1961 RepID=UPI00365530C8
MIATTPENLTTTTRTSRAGVTPIDYRVSLMGRAIGLVTDECGAVPSRGRYAAWSLHFGPKGFHATQDDAVARVVSAWLNCGYGPTHLMTATGTVHVARQSDVEGAGGRVPACMTDQTAASLSALLSTGRAVTCRRCPKG